METMRWKDHKLILINQVKLPEEISEFICETYQDVVYAIKSMVVRGAPAIGAAAAYGMALAVLRCKDKDLDACRTYLHQAYQELAATRPTAVNLFWALDRINILINNCVSVEEVLAKVPEEAHKILQEDIIINKKIGRFGEKLIPENATILTHCNAGALATGGYGTALGVIRAAQEVGKNIKVFADETRPLLQGARLTAYELMHDNIPVTLITDNMAGYVMKKGMIDAVVVGADRITARGDVANKIGTYSVAVLAKEHGIPFYVAAPMSTFDFTLISGEDIPIEERDAQEVREIYGQAIAPKEVKVFNPVFDVTPHHLISAIITDKGIIKGPNEDIVRQICEIKG